MGDSECRQMHCHWVWRDVKHLEGGETPGYRGSISYDFRRYGNLPSNTLNGRSPEHIAVWGHDIVVAQYLRVSILYVLNLLI